MQISYELIKERRRDKKGEIMGKEGEKRNQNNGKKNRGGTDEEFVKLYLFKISCSMDGAIYDKHPCY